MAKAGRAAVAAVLGLLIAVAGCGVLPDKLSVAAPAGASSARRAQSDPSSASPTGRGTSGAGSGAAARPELPRGGMKIFPRYRVVAYYGTAGTAALGVLGSRPPGQIATSIEKAAGRYATPDRVVQPAMELIVTIADSSPGADHLYRHSIPTKEVWRYLKVARAHQMLLILDIQPGQGDFLPLVKHWSGLLNQPDVGLALDSEWHMPVGTVPGQVIGHSTPADINAVSSWLAHLVSSRQLPQKLLLLHQFAKPMLRHPAAIDTPPQLAVVQQLDGFGSRTTKLDKYRQLQRPDQFHMGFKLFYQQDIDLLPPTRVLHLHPTPEYISYQ